MQGSETKASFHPQSRYGTELLRSPSQVSHSLPLLLSLLCDKSIYEMKEKEKKGNCWCDNVSFIVNSFSRMTEPLQSD